MLRWYQSSGIVVLTASKRQGWEKRGVSKRNENHGWEIFVCTSLGGRFCESTAVTGRQPSQNTVPLWCNRLWRWPIISSWQIVPPLAWYSCWARQSPPTPKATLILQKERERIRWHSFGPWKLAYRFYLPEIQLRRENWESLSAVSCQTDFYRRFHLSHILRLKNLARFLRQEKWYVVPIPWYRLHWPLLPGLVVSPDNFDGTHLWVRKKKKKKRQESHIWHLKIKRKNFGSSIAKSLNWKCCEVLTMANCKSEAFQNEN